MKKQDKALIVFLIIAGIIEIIFLLKLLLTALMIFIGGENYIKYHIRMPAEKAMEDYLEDKYHDNLTLVDNGIEDTFNFYWDKTGFWASFESESYPEVKISCSANLKKDKMSYAFNDDYQQMTYLSKIQKLAEKEAAEYFTGDYHVFVYPCGKFDNEDVEIMEFEDYIRYKTRFGICIFVEDMESDDAKVAIMKMENKMKNDGIKCSFSAARYLKEDGVIEKDAMAQGFFNPWYFEDVEWIYKHIRPLE